MESNKTNLKFVLSVIRFPDSGCPFGVFKFLPYHCQLQNETNIMKVYLFNEFFYLIILTVQKCPLEDNDNKFINEVKLVDLLNILNN
jgi:hypothetical protein